MYPDGHHLGLPTCLALYPIGVEICGDDALLSEFLLICANQLPADVVDDALIDGIKFPKPIRMAFIVIIDEGIDGGVALQLHRSDEPLSLFLCDSSLFLCLADVFAIIG